MILAVDQQFKNTETGITLTVADMRGDTIKTIAADGAKSIRKNATFLEAIENGQYKQVGNLRMHGRQVVPVDATHCYEFKTYKTFLFYIIKNGQAMVYIKAAGMKEKAWKASSTASSELKAFPAAYLALLNSDRIPRELRYSSKFKGIAE